MSEQLVFKRYEIKYALDEKTMEAFVSRMSNHMVPDPHGHSQIQSLYFDTPDYLLARRSMEHPMYKEKLRLRSYGVANEDTTVFLELKKKYDDVVYKRRITMKEDAAMNYIAGAELSGMDDYTKTDKQIYREIDYTFDRYEDLKPRMLLMYDRDAFYDKDDHEFRVTFDSAIRWRNTELDLKSGIYGERLVPKDRFLMEVKAGEAIPLWFVDLLTEFKLYKTSFSKYGTAYVRYTNLNRNRVANIEQPVSIEDRRQSYPVYARA